MTVVSLQNPDLLRRLAQPAAIESLTALAGELERDPSNLKKTLKKLESEGTVAGLGLTDLGFRVLLGLDIAEGRAEAPRAAITVEASPGDVIELHPSALRPNPDQPRKAFNAEDLEALAQSIADKGVLQPILARPAAAVPALDDAFPGDAHMIIAGERRWRACMKIVAAGEWPEGRTVTVKIGTPEDEADAYETAVVENMQRADFNHMEMGLAFERMAEAGRSNKDIAAIVGRTPEFVQQHRRLVKLSPEDQTRVATGALVMHDALEALRPDKPEKPAEDALSPGAELALIEIGWVITNDPFTAHGGPAAAKSNGYGYMSDAFRELNKRFMTVEQMPQVWGRNCCLIWPLDAGRDFLSARYPEGVTDADLQAARERIGRQDKEPGAGEDEGFFTYALNAKISRNQLEAARQTWEEPEPGRLLWLIEIGHKIAGPKADLIKGADRAIYLPEGQRDPILHHLTWAGLIRTSIERGKEFLRWTDDAQAVLRAQDLDPITSDALDEARARFDTDPETIAFLREEGRYVVPWLNPPANEAKTGPYVVNGVDYHNASRAQEARYAQGIEQRPAANSGGGSPKAADSGPAAPVQLTKRQGLVLIELAFKISEERRPRDPMADVSWTGDAAVDYAAFGCSCGSYWLDQNFNALAALRMVGAAHQTGGSAPLAVLTDKGVEALIAAGVSLPPSIGAVSNAQGDLGLSRWNEGKVGYRTAWLESIAEPAPAPDAADAPSRIQGDPNADPWDRTPDQVEADAALLARVTAWIEADADDGDPVESLFESLGVRRVSHDPEGWIELQGHDGQSVTAFTVDERNALPDERVAALERLIVYAVGLCLAPGSK